MSVGVTELLKVLLSRYEVDETSPEDTLEDALFCPDGSAACYQILSKPIGVRQGGSAGSHQPTCCEHCQHWLWLAECHGLLHWHSWLQPTQSLLSVTAVFMSVRKLWAVLRWQWWLPASSYYQRLIAI